MGEVLRYPTDRKRPYRSAYLRWDAEPQEGVVRLAPRVQPTFKHLRRTPELLLFMALLRAMDGPTRWRMAEELKKVEAGSTDEVTRETAADFLRLNMELPFHLEPKP